MLYFTSDLRLGSEFYLREYNRPWGSVPEMNDGLINNINSVCKETDVLYLLGNIINWSANIGNGWLDVMYHLSKIKASTVLVTGPTENEILTHEYLGDKNDFVGTFKYYGVDAVYFDKTELSIEGAAVCLAHNSYDVADSMLGLHGGVFSGRGFGTEGIHVTTDIRDYKPISLTTVKEDCAIVVASESARRAAGIKDATCFCNLLLKEVV